MEKRGRGSEREPKERGTSKGEGGVNGQGAPGGATGSAEREVQVDGRSSSTTATPSLKGICKSDGRSSQESPTSRQQEKRVTLGGADVRVFHDLNHSSSTPAIHGTGPFPLLPLLPLLPILPCSPCSSCSCTSDLLMLSSSVPGEAEIHQDE